jgi:hypothetical protein
VNRDHILGWHERLSSPGPALRSIPVDAPDTTSEDFERGDHSTGFSVEPELPEGVWEASAGVYMARCRSCERSYELCYDVRDFTEEGNVCGGSDRCVL